MQLPLAQSPGSAHPCPFARRHAPLPVQACVGSTAPPHTGLSSVPPTGMFEQVPSMPARAQDRQVAVHIESQQ